MKKIILYSIIALTVFQLSNCSKEDSSIVSNDGLVNFVAGNVKGGFNGKLDAVNAGDKITGGMTVITGTKSIVEIQLNGSIIRISENSELVMTELVKNLKDNKELTDVYLKNGQALFKVSKKLTGTDKYNVNTPTAVAGVRGTEFLVTADEAKSRIACMEGRVAVKGSSSDDSGLVMVEAGKEALVENGKPISIKNIQDDSLSVKKQETTVKQASVEKKVIPDSDAVKGPKKIRAQAIKGDIEGTK